MQAWFRQATAADTPAIQRIYAYGDAHHRAQAPWFFAQRLVERLGYVTVRRTMWKHLAHADVESSE